LLDVELVLEGVDGAPSANVLLVVDPVVDKCHCLDEVVARRSWVEE